MSSKTLYSIRDARPSELEQAARILHDAFFTSREHRYFAGATADNPGAHVLGTQVMPTRLRFYLSNARATLLLGGKVRLAVDANDEIVGTMLLLPPNKRIGISPILLYRSGFVRVLYDWGWRGFKRIVKDWEDIIEEKTEETISKDEELGSWFLHMFGVDPKLKRKGIGSLLLQDMMAIVDDGAHETILYCATPQNRDFYTKFGFVERGRWRMLSGKADENGWPVEEQQDQLAEELETSYVMIRPKKR